MYNDTHVYVHDAHSQDFANRGQLKKVIFIIIIKHYVVIIVINDSININEHLS